MHDHGDTMTIEQRARALRERLEEVYGIKPTVEWQQPAEQIIAHHLQAVRREALEEELNNLALWIRQGNYKLYDAQDEIARAVENRARAIRAAKEQG